MTRRILAPLLICGLLLATMACKPAPPASGGTAVLNGQQLEIAAAYARWDKRSGSLWIDFLPFDLTEEELATARERHMWQPVFEQRGSPDPQRWNWVPYVRLIFRGVGSGATIPRAQLAGTPSLHYHWFEKRGTTTSLNGTRYAFDQKVTRFEAGEILVEGSRIPFAFASAGEGGGGAVESYALSYEGDLVVYVIRD